MIQEPDRSTPMLWARFRFSVVGPLLSSPPPRGELNAALQTLAAKTWKHPVSGGPVEFSAVTIQRWYYAARREQDDPRPRLATRRAQRLRPGVPGRGAGRIAVCPVPPASALELPTALRQPGRPRQGPSRLGAAPLVLHGSAVHAGSRPGAHAAARAQTPPRPRAGRPATREPRDPQLRSRVRRLPLASGLPPRLAPGAHAPRPVAASAGLGHPRRLLAAGLPSPVVSLGDGRGSGAWAFSGDSEAGAVPGVDDRQRRGDDRRGSSAKGCWNWGSSTRRRCRTVPTRTASRSVSGRPWKAA